MPHTLSDLILDESCSKSARVSHSAHQDVGGITSLGSVKPGRLEVLAITCGSLLELGFRVSALENNTARNNLQHISCKYNGHTKDECTDNSPEVFRPSKRALLHATNKLAQADTPPAKRCHSSPKHDPLEISETDNQILSFTTSQRANNRHSQQRKRSVDIQPTNADLCESPRVSNQKSFRHLPTSSPTSSKRFHSPLKWSKEEDRRLEEGVELYKLPNWKMIAKHVRTRSNKVCAQRWRHNLRPEVKLVKKGKWTKEEDDKLWQILYKYTCRNERTWDKASEGMGFTRNSIQCRERWKNFLDPSLRFGPWTAEEDACLIRLHAQYGKQWKKFTSTLAGRSAQRIRRRFAILENRQNR